MTKNCIHDILMLLFCGTSATKKVYQQNETDKVIPIAVPDVLRCIEYGLIDSVFHIDQQLKEDAIYHTKYND